MQTSGSYLANAFQGMSNQVVLFLPKLLTALVVFIAGWVIAAAIAEIIARIVKSLKIDTAFRSIGMDEIMKKAGYELDSGAFLGALVKLFIIVVFLLTSLEILGLNQVTVLLGSLVLRLLPDLIIVVILFFAAAVISDAGRKFVVASARASNVPHAHFLGEVTRWVIWIFAILLSLMPLMQSNVGATALNTLFLGVVFAISLSFGLAFGLGGKDVAGRFLEKWVSNMER